jgi:uncharacterized protein (DUF58 family)
VDRLAPANVIAHAENARRIPFAFGRRFFFLLFLGLFWVVPAWIQPRMLYLMLIWDVFVLCLWAYDLQRLPRPGQLEVRRLWHDPLGLAEQAQVTIETVNHSRVSISAQIYDETPETFSAGLPGGESLSIPAGNSGALTYTISPSARGDVDFHDVWLKYRTAWNIAERWARARLSQSVRVYPSLRESRKMRVYLIRSRQIELEKRLKHQRGQGREFESLREYRSGDEFRDISWKATARRGKLITKIYQVERSQTLWLVIDAGRLLRARVDGLAKLDYAINAALGLAQVALYSGDRVALLAYGRRPQQRVAPNRGSAHLRMLLESMAQVHAEGVEADHMLATEALLSSQSRRSLVVWMTDLAETAATPEVIECTAALAKRHLVLFVVMAQTEMQNLATESPENVHQMYRQSAAIEILQRREVLLSRLRRQGALIVQAAPGGMSTALANKYLEVKERSLL